MGFGSNWRNLVNEESEEITAEEWERWGCDAPPPMPEPPEDIPPEYFWNEAEMVKPTETTIARGETSDTLLSIFISKGELQFSQLEPWTMEETVTPIDWDKVQELISAHSMEVSEEGKALLAEHLNEKTKETVSPDVATNKDGVSVEVSAFIDFSQMTIERYGITETNCYTVHPEQDLLEEIYRRICQVDITFEEIDTERLAQMEKAGDIVLAIETEEESFKNTDDVDLRIINLENGQAVSVPITQKEAENAVTTAVDFEKNPEKYAGKADVTKTADKEAPEITQE